MNLVFDRSFSVIFTGIHHDYTGVPDRFEPVIFFVHNLTIYIYTVYVLCKCSKHTLVEVVIKAGLAKTPMIWANGFGTTIPPIPSTDS